MSFFSRITGLFSSSAAGTVDGVDSLEEGGEGDGFEGGEEEGEGDGEEDTPMPELEVVESKETEKSGRDKKGKGERKGKRKSGSSGGDMQVEVEGMRSSQLYRSPAEREEIYSGGDVDMDMDMENNTPMPAVELVTKSKSEKKKKKKQRQRESVNEDEEVMDSQEAGVEVVEEFPTLVLESAKSKRRRSKSRGRKSASSQPVEVVEVPEENAVLRDDGVVATPKSSKRKSRSRSRRLSSSQPVEAIEVQEEEEISAPKSSKAKKRRNKKTSSAVPVERSQEVEETPAPESTHISKPPRGRRSLSVQPVHNTFPEVRIEENSAVMFPREEPSSSKRKRKSGVKKKRKRVVDSDEEVSSQVQVEEVLEKLPKVTEDHTSKRKKKSSDGKKKQKVVESDEDIAEKHVSLFEEEPVEEEILDNDDSEEEAEEDEENPDAMVSMLNSAIRRGNPPKVSSPEKKKTTAPVVPPVKASTPILPPTKTTNAILPPVPAWKSQIALQSKSAIRPKVEPIRSAATISRQATPLWQSPRLQTTREVSGSPAPIRHSLISSTLVLPPKSSQAILPPSRASTPILPPSRSQSILPPSRGSTPIVPPARSQSILPPSRASTPIVTSSRSQATVPHARASTPIVPASKPTTPAVSSARTQSSAIRSSSFSTPILPVSRTPEVTSSSFKSRSTIPPPPKFGSPILPPGKINSPASLTKSPIDAPSKPISKAFSSSTPQVIIRSRPKPSLLSRTHFAALSSGSPVSVSARPEKVEQAKESSKSEQLLSDESDTDEDESKISADANPPRKSLTSTTLPLNGNNVLEESESDVSSDESEDDEDEEPKQLSEKALGKRKAEDEPEIRPTKKKQTRRESTASRSGSRHSITPLPFQPSSSIQSNVRSGSVKGAAHSISGGRSTSSTPAPILPGSRPGLVESHRAIAHFPIPPIASANGSRASSSTPILPPVVRASLGFQRRSTPQFTPINKSANAKSLYSPAVVLPSSSYLKINGLKSPSLVSSKSKARSVEPTSSIEAAKGSVLDEDVDMADADADMMPLILDDDQERASTSEDSSESNDDQDKGKSQTPFQVNSVSPPRSNIRRKRRLPIGNDETNESLPSRSAPKAPASSSKSATSGKANTSKLRETRVRGVNKEDAATIQEAVANFGSQHDMEQSALNAYIQVTGDATKNEFWNEIWTQVPHIPMATVQNYCRRAFHNFTRGSWSLEQDEELADAYTRFPNQWGKISELTNRSAEHARVRYRDYVALANTLKTDAWDMEEEDRLRQVHAEYLELIRVELEKPDNRKDRKTKWADVQDPESLVDWTVVSQRMGNTRSRLQCFTKWKVIQAREAEEREKLNPVGTNWRVRAGVDASHDLRAEQKLQFLRAVRDSGAGSTSRIPWTTISNELGMGGKRMSLKVCLRNLMVNVPNYENMALQEMVSSLIYSYEAASPYEPQGFDKIDKTVQAAMDVKSRNKRPSKYVDEGFAARQGVDNGEGSSKKRSRKSKSNRRVTPTQSEEEDEPEVPVTERTKKIRERMKREDEDHSQETPPLAEDDDGDIGGELQTAWSSVTPKTKAKKPIFTPKISQRKRARRYSYSEDDSDLVAQEDGLGDGDAMQVDQDAEPEILDDDAASEESHDEAPQILDHASESAESNEDGQPAESDNEKLGLGKGRLANPFIDDEAGETSDDNSSDSESDEQESEPASHGNLAISSPAVVKSEDMDEDDVPFGDRGTVNYSDIEVRDNNLLAGTNSTSSGSDSSERSTSEEVLQQQDDPMEDIKPHVQSDAFSGSDTDSNSTPKSISSEESEVVEETHPLVEQPSSSESESESDSDEEPVKENIPNLPSPPRPIKSSNSQSNGIQQYTSPTIKVNSSSPILYGTINSYHSSSPSPRAQNDQSNSGNRDDANEHTITMNGWGELPKVMDSSSDDDSSDEEEKILETKVPSGARNSLPEEESSNEEEEQSEFGSMQQESYEEEVNESDHQLMLEEDVEMSDQEEESYEPREEEDEREIMESELDLPPLKATDSLIDEQTILESERDIIQDALSSPALKNKPTFSSSSKSNSYSLGSAWERTRQLLERDDDGDISISSDDTTSSIPAVAVLKARVAREESLEL